MTDIISDVSALVTALFGTNGWVSSVITVITSNGILIIGVITGLSGLAVGMVHRLMNIK